MCFISSKALSPKIAMRQNGGRVNLTFKNTWNGPWVEDVCDNLSENTSLIHLCKAEGVLPCIYVLYINQCASWTYCLILVLSQAVPVWLFVFAVSPLQPAALHLHLYAAVGSLPISLHMHPYAWLLSNICLWAACIRSDLCSASAHTQSVHYFGILVLIRHPVHTPLHAFISR